VGTAARLSQIKFTESVNTKKASLEVSLPDRPTEQVTMDKAVPFFVLVVPTDRVDEIRKSESKIWTEKEIVGLSVGFVRLELIPRGKGRLLVRAPQLYFAFKPDQTVDMTVDVRNEGTRRLDNIRIDLDIPLNWAKVIEPQVIPKLDIDEEQRVMLKITPAADVSVGRYEVRLRTTALSDNQPVNAEDKTAIMEIQAETSVIGTILLVLLILGLVSGMVVFGIRLSRK